MNEREILKYKLMMYGYEYGIEPIQINDKLLEIAKFFAKNQQIVKSKTNDCLYKVNQTEISDSTRKFFDKRFKLHKVPYITEEEAKLIEKEYIEKKYGYDFLLRETKEKSILVDPFEIPVEHNENMLGGKVRKPIFILADEEYLKQAQINFSKIILGDNLSKLSISTYGHEITHTQLDSIKGSIRNYHNKEFLSIFIEKLISSNLDNKSVLFKKYLLNRYRNTLEQLAILYSPQSFKYNELLEATVYLESTLKADNLFDKYMSGNSKLKNEILDDIQKVFDGILNVEQLLKKYNITLENSSNVQLVKKYL